MGGVQRQQRRKVDLSVSQQRRGGGAKAEEKELEQPLGEEEADGEEAAAVERAMMRDDDEAKELDEVEEAEEKELQVPLSPSSSFSHPHPRQADAVSHVTTAAHTRNPSSLPHRTAFSAQAPLLLTCPVCALLLLVPGLSPPPSAIRLLFLVLLVLFLLPLGCVCVVSAHQRAQSPLHPSPHPLAGAVHSHRAAHAPADPLQHTQAMHRTQSQTHTHTQQATPHPQRRALRDDRDSMLILQWNHHHGDTHAHYNSH